MPSRWDTPTGPEPGGPPPIASEPLGSSPTVRVVHPPVAVLVVAALCVLVSLVCFAVDSLSINVIGYVAGGIAVPILVTLYRWADQRRREDPHYQPLSAADGLAIGVLLFGFLLCAIPHMWRVATELSK